jgi:hypothetical protein
MNLDKLRELVREEVEKAIDEDDKVFDYVGFRRQVGRSLGRKLVEGEFNAETFFAWRELLIESRGDIDSEHVEFYVGEAINNIKRMNG